MPTPPFPPQLPSGRTFDVVGLGANADDQLFVIPRHPAPGEKVRFASWTRQGGGQAATAMVTVARLGHRARYIGGVGDDDAGARNVEELRREGVDVSTVRQRPGKLTQRAVILVDAHSGERTIVWGRDQGMLIDPEELSRDEITCGSVLHVDGQNPYASARAARMARDSGMFVLADLEAPRPGVAELLPHVDVLIAAEEFPLAYSGAHDLDSAMRTLEGQCAGGCVIATLGARGAVARLEGRLEHFPAYAVEAVDTTGAGDVFHGAFAVACMRGMDLGQAIDFSHAVAAMKCLSLGGRSAIPRSMTEVDRFRRETPLRQSP
jgi:sulfofructose kinase